jgi:hypothetical protein
VPRPWYGPEADAGAGPSDYTTTNVQEEGVDELDLVKTDGNYLYVTENDLFAVVRSWPPERSELAATLRLEGYSHGLFLHRDLAVVFSNYFDNSGFAPDERVMPEYWGGTRIELIDVGDRGTPTILRTIDVEGHLVDARLIDGHVYAVITTPMEIPAAAWELLQREDLGLPEVDWDASDEEREAAAAEARWILGPLIDEIVARLELDELVPLVRDRAIADTNTPATPLLGCNELYRPAETSQYSVLSVLHLDLDHLQPAAGPLDAIGLLANGSTVYASSRNLYVAQSGVWWWWGWGDLDDTTSIHKFELAPTNSDPIRYAASGKVEGWLLNQFSMDEHQGFLRVATTKFDWWWGTTEDQEDGGSLISVLSDNGRGNLARVGHVTGIAPGERMYSCRFMADKGYLVTFELVDPLFTIDLSDPFQPTVVGELEVTGFSSYLHPVDDRYLLAVGLEADEDGAPIGLAVSIFDVTDFAQPALMDRHLIEDEERVWSWSEALNDHHAFTYHKGILSIPAYIRGDHDTFSGLIVLLADPLLGIGELGRVDHSGLPSGPWGSSSWMRRSVYIEHALYSLSNLGIKVNRLHQPEELIAEVPFYERGDEESAP